MKSAKYLRPFFSYYGGKWRDAIRNYPVPAYDTIIEPFAGSAGYSLRYPDRTVVLYEIDPVIVAVWRFLIAAKPEEILAIPDVPLHGTSDDLKICQEAKWLVGFWLNRGAASPRRSPSRWMRDRIRPGSFWGERVRNTIASQLDSIRHWKVQNSGYIECPDGLEATWFVDPPYQVAGRHYRFGSEIIDYTALGGWCQRRCGQVDLLIIDELGFVPHSKTGAELPLSARCIQMHRPCARSSISSTKAFGSCMSDW